MHVVHILNIKSKTRCREISTHFQIGDNLCPSFSHASPAFDADWMMIFFLMKNVIHRFDWFGCKLKCWSTDRKTKDRKTMLPMTFMQNFYLMWYFKINSRWRRLVPCVVLGIGFSFLLLEKYNVRFFSGWITFALKLNIYNQSFNV